MFRQCFKRGGLRHLTSIAHSSRGMAPAPFDNLFYKKHVVSLAGAAEFESANTGVIVPRARFKLTSLALSDLGYLGKSRAFTAWLRPYKSSFLPPRWCLGNQRCSGPCEVTVPRGDVQNLLVSLLYHFQMCLSSTF